MCEELKVLVACEFSGTVRSEFEKRGHYAVSCDLIPSEIKGNHYQGDVNKILDMNWDLLIAHPPCTYLCNSGVRWLYNKDGTVNEERWKEMEQAATFFNRLLNANIPKICIENPIQHRYAKERISTTYSQIIQPWQFGHGETKATCLWLKGLQPLKPTNPVEGRENRIHRMAPSKTRGMDRSRTYRGIARAMAEQFR